MTLQVRLGLIKPIKLTHMSDKLVVACKGRHAKTSRLTN